MGIDYHASLAVGFRITHALMEPLWDAENEMFDFNDIGYEYEDALIDDICSRVNAQFWSDGSCYGDPKNVTYVIGPPRFPARNKGRLMSLKSNISLAELAALAPELERIGKELRAMGIKVEEAIVTAALLES